MKNITIIGLGYVGYPLAELCLKKGKRVFGIDKEEKKIDMIRRGMDPVEKKRNGVVFEASSGDKGYINQSDVIIICVPTPVDKLKMPDLGPVIRASGLAAENMGVNKPLVIVESTINPGVMEDIVEPVFRSKGLSFGIDYNLAHCPERINPGDKKWDVTNIPRVVGGFTQECTDRAHQFYTSILDADVKKMSDVKTAEAVKIVENSFRDVNIAFVNELAQSFSKMNIDIVEVIKGASTKPFGFMPHYPSCGVGGHCIPVDPYYLIEKAKTVGFDHKFLKLAREINNSMPEYTIGLLSHELNKHRMSVNGTRIGVLGLSYKANVGDLRESPALQIIQILKNMGAEMITYDPYIASDCKSLEEFQQKCRIMILCADHDEFEKLDLDKVDILIDGKNMFYGKEMPCAYRGIGRNAIRKSEGAQPILVMEKAKEAAED